MNDLRVFYWSAEKAEAQVDFILQAGGRIIPLEVKAEENLRAKSLTSYRERYSPALSIRASMSDHRQEDWLLNIPLYRIHATPSFLPE